RDEGSIPLRERRFVTGEIANAAQKDIAAAKFKLPRRPGRMSFMPRKSEDIGASVGLVLKDNDTLPRRFFPCRSKLGLYFVKVRLPLHFRHTRLGIRFEFLRSRAGP